jgi:hypothetical protein
LLSRKVSTIFGPSSGKLHEGFVGLMRSYGIFTYGSLRRISAAVNVPFRHFSRRNYCVTQAWACVIQPAHCFAYPALLVASCCVMSALAGCGGSAYMATGTQTGSLSASAAAVTFGSIALGQTANSSIILSNTSLAAVQLTGVSVTGQSFAVSGGNALPVSIPSHGTYSVNVTFSPVAAGAVSGQLTIASNASNGESMVIGLNGTGMLATPTISLASLNCASSSLTGAATDNCTVALNGAAASGGFPVILSSNNGSVTVPATVTVAAGANSASFAATVSSVNSPQAVTLTASAGGASDSFALQLNVSAPSTPAAPLLSGLTCASASVSAAGVDNCTVTLNAAAPDGGFQVNLSSDNSLVTVPTTTMVPAGANNVIVAATVSSYSSPETVTLTATAGDVTQTFALQLDVSVQNNPAPPLLSGLTCATRTINAAGTDNCTVTLSAAAPDGGFQVNLSSDNSLVAVPPTVMVQAGASNVVFAATISSFSSPASVTLTASAGSVTETVALQLIDVISSPAPPVLSGLSCPSGPLTGTSTVTCAVTLSGPAGSGGFQVSLSSSSQAVTLPTTATVSSGATTASFTATASAVSAAQSVTLTASAGGITETASLQLGATGTGLTLSTNSVAFGDVSLNSPATQSITLTSTGATPVGVSVALVTGAGFTLSGASLPLTINSGQAATLNVQFDPTTAGTATGTLTIVSTDLANPTMTVSLSGNGVTITYGVDLSWSAPTSSTDPVAGYNIYRSPSGASSYQQLNSAVVTQATYADNTAQAGQSYDYMVESVDASGVESAPSNIASFTIP